MNRQSIAETEKEIVEEFELFDDPVNKYEYLIDIGHQLPEMPQDLKTDANIIDGCTSRVWISAVLKDQRVYYQADSNTVITKGIIALLLRVLNGRKPAEIIDAQLDFLQKINMHNLLSEQRSNGLQSMIRRIKREAQKFIIA